MCLGEPSVPIRRGLLPAFLQLLASGKTPGLTPGPVRPGSRAVHFCCTLLLQRGMQSGYFPLVMAS
jgi:hypothetical protein